MFLPKSVSSKKKLQNIILIYSHYSHLRLVEFEDHIIMYNIILKPASMFEKQILHGKRSRQNNLNI